MVMRTIMTVIMTMATVMMTMMVTKRMVMICGMGLCTQSIPSL